MKSVGIDIGSFSIKVAEIDGGTKVTQLTRFIELPLSTDPSKDKKIEIIEHLRRITSDYDEGTRFVLGLRQEKVAIRSRTFPFRERFKILKSVAFELEDDLPFQEENAIFDIKILRYQGSAAQVLALACPKENIAESLSLAQDCGFEAEILSVEGLALANMFEPWQSPPPERPADYQATPEPKEAQLVLDIGHEKTLILAFAEGSLAAVRTVDWGARDLAKDVGLRYNIHVVEALKEVQRKAFILVSNENATSDQQIFSDIIKKSIDRLCQDLKLHKMELAAELNVNFTGATLLGGASPIRNLTTYLTQKLEVAVNRQQQFDGLGGVQTPEEFPNGHRALVAMGLALEGFKRPRNPAINLIRGEFAKQSEVLTAFWEKWGHTVQVAGAAFVLLMIYGMVKEDLATRLNDATSATLKQQAQVVANLSGVQASPRNIRKFIRQQEQIEKLRATAEKVNELNSALDLVKQISQKVPSRAQMPMDVTHLKVSGETVEMAGRIPNSMNLKDFMQQLSNLSGGKVDPYPANVSAKSGYQNFGVKLLMPRKQGG